MAYSRQPYASPPPNHAHQRPGLPPVPPQLLSPKPQPSPIPGGPRPPLPPVPGNYLAQAADEQRHSFYGPPPGYGGGNVAVVSPKPQRAEPVIPAEALQSQADSYGRGGPPRLQLNFEAGPLDAHSVVSAAPSGPHPSYYQRPASALAASPPPMGEPQAGYQPFGQQAYLAPGLQRRSQSDQGAQYGQEPGLAHPGSSTPQPHPMQGHYGHPGHPGRPGPPPGQSHQPMGEFGLASPPPAATWSHSPHAMPQAFAQVPPRAQTVTPLEQGMQDMRLQGGPAPAPSQQPARYKNPAGGAGASAQFTPPNQPAQTFGSPPQHPVHPYSPQQQPFSPPPAGGGPAAHQLTAEPVPDMATLTASFESIFGPSASRTPAATLTSPQSLSNLPRPELSRRIRWCRQILRYIERIQTELASAGGSTRITDQQLVRFVDIALKFVLSAAAAPISDAEALYLRGDLTSTGAFPAYKAKDAQAAFLDFEQSAGKGYKPSWFRIGREYEAFREWDRARGAHERGSSLGDCAATYRLGMAYLLGQLALQIDVVKAVAYLRSAADLADVDTPQPAYIFGMLLAGEFESLPTIPADILRPNIAEARSRVERAAYLGFAAAQYKMGWLHEYAQMGCAADPLLSVEYYSLASKQGEVEADLALSKWFLCGSEPSFPRNEVAAMEFAEKAARKGLPSAMFAVGFYLEVGIGTGPSSSSDPTQQSRGQPDLAAAEKWYVKAVEAGNKDAEQRLQALRSGQGATSRRDFEQQVDTELVRKRTMAVQKYGGGQAQQGPGRDMRRKQTLRRVEEARQQAQMTVAESKAAGRKPGGRWSTQEPVPPVPAIPAGVGSTSPRPRPSEPSPRPQQHRLSDASASTSSTTSPKPGRTPTPAAPSSMTTPAPPSSAPSNAPSIATKPPTAFTTFADMGIPTTKAKKDSDCVLM